ncbi:peptidase domain-containing ABC transporter [Oryzomicrobium sp.]|uniref:peptidase domain-containing ABC transporter n=1 Tax=Oryzomicrobium sp. TaxID=1911578 RepID=UPI0025D0689F|nr:peptidase domain-containing ABC transporter [Oryzomicrobium sp.]MCE1242900.1 peptidase domain-containing ABC transporter [Oryzomicrobium sp.]
MPRRFLELVTSRRPQATSSSAPGEESYAFSAQDLVWAMGSFCALNRKPFDPELLLSQFPPPYGAGTLIHAARAIGFRIRRQKIAAEALGQLTLPCLVILRENTTPPAATTSASHTSSLTPEIEAQSEAPPPTCRPAIVIQAGADKITFFAAGTNSPQTLTPTQFAEHYTGIAFQLALASAPVRDPDGAAIDTGKFGFRWFIPELLKHRHVWRDVLIASLVIQLLALGTPLFTQVIIDKVVVHRTESTLLVIGIGLAVFMIFSSLLTWVRQYLVLHTGNRVDAVLGAAVFDHLFKLPPRYFEHRPTGVIAARLHGVETIREFVASAAVTLILDLPFLLLFVGIMFYYSVGLTFMALALIGCIVGLSLVMAPVFRARLNEQFLLGARNQAFVTEYVSGLETVKSLQMEPQLKSRYSDYLADYLRSGFRMKQIANTYNVAANGIEQLMTLLILVVGAYTVMNGSDFTIGMLIAFQMFASRVSQPMLRLVGLWQQFQQANLSVQRLGDIMNAPTEPYSVLPNRLREGQGKIEIEDLSFRYGEDLPFLYQGFHMAVTPGEIVAIMGPSGSGKSTLSKLLQGFYAPSSGTIKLDRHDIRHLSANELRHTFGVVPQETVLFSGTLYDNLLMANPHATFEQITKVCRMAEIHEVIERLPQGYQTEIGERGAGLSGGQKQRLAIARALLKQPKVLIFDEATSSLDAQTAEHFATTINQLKGKVTMLFITHAMPKALQVDRLIHIGNPSSHNAEHQKRSPG